MFVLCIPGYMRVADVSTFCLFVGVMILGMSFSCLAPLGLLWVMVSPDASPWWYYLAHASNCLVSWTAVCISAMSDVMPPEWRAPSVGLVMAGIMLGISISPSMALLADPIHMAWLSVVLTFGALAVSICFFPETLPPHVREEARKRSEAEYVERTFMGKLTWSVTRPFRELSILNRNSFFRLLSCLGFFSGMVSSGDRTLLVYYVEERLAFDASDVAYMFLLVGGMGFLTQILILKPANDLIGERWLITSCFIVSVIQNLLYGLATEKSMIYASAAIGALTTMAYPTISAVKANNVVSSHETILFETFIL
jgi:MFS transporter, DHA1 family, tetracycline resistance protein